MYTALYSIFRCQNQWRGTTKRLVVQAVMAKNLYVYYFTPMATRYSSVRLSKRRKRIIEGGERGRVRDRQTETDRERDREQKKWTLFRYIYIYCVYFGPLLLGPSCAND